MDEDLKTLWKSHRPDSRFSANLSELIENYKNEEKSVFKSKLWASIYMALTSAFLVWMVMHYQWTEGIKFWGVMLIIIDMILVNILFWSRAPRLEFENTDISTKDITLMMVRNLKDQINYNRYILPVYGLLLTIGLLMVYSELVPRITADPIYQMMIYGGVILFTGILMSIGIVRKNKHISSNIHPMLNELKEFDDTKLQ
jgi:hypothetical protein